MSDAEALGEGKPIGPQSRLGAQTAFSLNAEALSDLQAAIQRATRVSPEAIAGIQKLSQALESSRPSAQAVQAMAESVRKMQADLPQGYWSQLYNTARSLQQSVSVQSLYSPEQLKLRSDGQRARPRSNRTAEQFFDDHAVDIVDVRTMLKALAKLQEKNHEHALVWRGQQNASWPVHSSLYRRLDQAFTPAEDELVAAEMDTMSAARRWGERPADALEFLADLQHNGAPTRLLDVTVDPEVAAWFATQKDPECDDSDGRIVGWGRRVRISTRKLTPLNDQLYEQEQTLFWHSWLSDEDRGRVGWGTGTRTWSWFPHALSERMRAQRAGFLLEAGPLLTPAVAEVISEGMSTDWRNVEISHATSILGAPARHDVRTNPNDANLVPIFSMRIAARAKPEIQHYLTSKGLSFPALYPDRTGLVSYLRGPSGL